MLLRSRTCAALVLVLFACNGKDDDTPAESLCTDGQDNDGDGQTDCDDSDCSATLACETDTDTDTDTDSDTDTDTDTDTDVPVNLSAADATFYGEDEGDRSAFAIRGGADINSDGYDDILIGAYLHTCVSDEGLDLPEAGAAYVVFGPVTGEVQLEDADISVCGLKESYQLGRQVEASGDVTGDGKTDLLIGAPQSKSGRVYIFSGPEAGTHAVNEDGVIELRGENSAYHFGFSLDASGIGADETPYVLVGSDAYSTSTVSNLGRVYLFQGPITEDLGASDALAEFTGESAGDSAGRDLAFVDLDGDGSDEVVIGAWQAKGAAAESGVVYVQYDLTVGSIDLGSADTILNGTTSGEFVGHAVKSAGDFNNDGREDLIVGAYGAANESGAAYILFGTVLPFESADISVADTRLDGDRAYDRAGHAVDGVGDINGDGIDDVVVGAFGFDSGLADRGTTYLVPGPFAGTVDLEVAALETFEGRKTDDATGHRLSKAGDVNKDGTPDFLIGAWRESTVDDDAGATYLIHGAASW